MRGSESPRTATPTVPPGVPETWIVPEREPRAVALNVTVTVHDAFAISVVQLLACVKSPEVDEIVNVPVVCDPLLVNWND